MKLPFASFARLTRALALGVLPSLLATACSSANVANEAANEGAAQAGGAGSAQTPEGDAVATEDELRASCTNPRRYFVTLREGSGTCEPIQGRRGQWLPEPLFADAPEDVQVSTCAYRWSGEKYSRPDREALATTVTYANGLAPACGRSSKPDVGLLQPIPTIDVFAQAGSVGCDVCGVLRKGRVWVILPPEKIAQRQFEVSLDNGQKRAFQIEASDARALSITLPPPPPGTQYTAGRVHIY